jgi:hypothetical protein
MIIKNYGLYWDKDAVNWEAKETRLMGYYGNDKNNKTCLDKQIGVYILYLIIK